MALQNETFIELQLGGCFILIKGSFPRMVGMGQLSQGVNTDSVFFLAPGGYFDELLAALVAVTNGVAVIIVVIVVVVVDVVVVIV